MSTSIQWGDGFCGAFEPALVMFSLAFGAFFAIAAASGASWLLVVAFLKVQEQFGTVGEWAGFAGLLALFSVFGLIGGYVLFSY